MLKQTNIDRKTLLEEYKNVECLNKLVVDHLRTSKKLTNFMLEAFGLYGDNKKKFKEIFGDQNFCYTTWYRSWNWVFEYKSYFFVASCSIRGTSYWVLSGPRTEPYDDISKEECAYEFQQEIMKVLSPSIKERR
jgi:hypothetical protein